MTSQNQNTLFDAAWEAVGQYPPELFLLMLLLVGFFFSTATMMLTLLLFLILRCMPSFVVVSMMLMGFVLLIIQVWFFAMTPPMVYHLNQLFYSALLNDQLHTFTLFYLFLTAFPYAIICGALLALVLRWRSTLHHELKRVGAGKLRKASAFIPPKKLQKQLNQISSAATAEGSILGVDRYTAEIVCLTDRDANLHTLSIGTTGSGKTTTLANLVESAIVRQLPVFYVDGKGDLAFAQAVEHFATEHHVPFYCFSMLGPSCRYNPIATGGFTSKKDRIIELRQWSEDHYRKLAERYLQGVFELLEQRGMTVDLHTLSQYLEPTALYQLARTTQNAKWMERISTLESDYKDIRSLICEIQNMANSEIGDLLDTSKENVIELSTALSENAVVYFCLQPLAFPAYAETLGKLIINDIKALLASRLVTKKHLPLLTFFDEFSVFAGDQIVHLINQGRSAGMHAVLATQSLSDIQRKGGDALMGQILNNVNNYVIQRQNYPGDAEILADIIGTQDSFEVTSQLNADSKIARTGTVRQARQFLVHPDEIKRLGLGEAIFVNKQAFRMQRLLIRRGSIV